MIHQSGPAANFRSVYEEPGVYDQVLLRHFFSGREDTDLVSEWLTEHYGDGARQLRVVEFGCGTGRVTERTAPYAETLLGCDYSPVMTEAFADRFPQASTLCADTGDAVAHLLDGRSGSFDLVSAFWSLSYPLGACYETLDEEGIVPVEDMEAAGQAANALIDGLIHLVAPDGHLVALIFDSDSPEQRLVTWVWEKIAPTPFGDRGYTRKVLQQRLLVAEWAGLGSLTWTRKAGTALAPDKATAVRWFTAAHFKDLPRLTNDPQIMAAVDDFVDQWTNGDHTVTFPTGVHLIDFHRGTAGAAHLPGRLP